MSKLIPWIGIVLLIPSLILNLFLLRNGNNDRGVKVIEVLDGDTILLDGKVRFRLRHVDAPELKYCGGEEAKQYLVDLVKNKKLRITEERLDQYGRPMGLVYINNNVLVNFEMLKSGWARYHSDTTSKTDLLKKIANYSKENKLGIYSSKCYSINPSNPECIIKGNIDQNGTKKLYYLPGCAQYKFTIVEKDIGEDWFCAESDAQKAGFTKAQTCK